MQNNFTPRYCDYEEEIPTPIYCRGCGYKKTIQKKMNLFGKKVVCERDVLKKTELLEEVITELRDKNSGLISIEFVTRNSWDLKRELGLEDLSPFPLKQYSSKGEGLIRTSDLTAPCPHGVLVKDAEKPERVKHRAELGTEYHSFTLDDPELKEYEVYLPWFFIDDQTHTPRSEYCEVDLFGKLEEFEIEMSGHPDAAFLLGTNGFVADLKFTRAPPFYPYIGHSNQLAGYGMLIESITGIPVTRGMVIYAEKLGGRFSPRVVDISEGSRARERAKKFIRETILLLDGSIDPKEYKLQQRWRKCKGCYNEEFCANLK